MLITLGFCVGIFVGLSGLGGFLITPVMLQFAGATLTTAVFTALVANFGMNLLAGVSYWLSGSVAIDLLLFLTAGTLLGGGFVSQILDLVPQQVAIFVIGGLLIVLGVRILGSGNIKQFAFNKGNGPKKTVVAVLSGFAAVIVAAFTGIGGPAVVVPILIGFGVPQQKAVGTSLCHGIVVTAVAMLVLNTTTAPGDINIVQVAIVGSAAIASASLAAVFSNKIKNKRCIEVMVGVLSIVAGLLMFL